jgi:hypothetical protein
MMNRLPAAIALSLLFALSAAADTTLLVSLQHFPSFDAVPGDELTLLPTIWNTGSEAARDVVLTFTIPPGSVFTAQTTPSDWTCTADRSTMTCRIASIAQTGPDIGVGATFKAIVGGESTGDLGLHYTLTSANAPRVEQTLQFFVWRLLEVTNTDDSGTGSLRDVLERANQLCTAPEERCRIDFDLPAPATFEPRTPLPHITTCGLVWIKAEHDSPNNQFELSGARVSSGSGLEVRANCNDGSRMLWVTGLTINRFPENGVHLQPTGATYETRLSDVRIGTDGTGTEPRPNRWRGIMLTSPSAVLILHSSHVSSNGRSGIFIWEAQGVEIRDTKIAGNGASGIFLFRGHLGGDSNTIVQNAHWGISVVPGASMGMVHRNRIYANGASPIDWGLDGRTLHELPGSAAAPVIQSATYDPATHTTTIRGTLTVQTVLGTQYSVSVYANPSGRPEAEQWLGATSPLSIPVAAPGVYAWEVQVPFDHRGRILTAVTGVAIAEDLPTHTGSELSLPFTVPGGTQPETRPRSYGTMPKVWSANEATQ